MTSVLTTPPNASRRSPSPNASRREAARSAARGSAAGRWLGVALMVLCAAGAALPLLLLVMNAFKDNGEILANPIAPPSPPHVANLGDAWQGGSFGASLGGSFLNSVLVTALAVTLVSLVSALAGYALGGFRFRGEKYVTLGLLVLLAVPTQATLIPVWDMMGQWELRNSHTGIVLVYAAFWMPFSVLLARAAFRSFPRELLEAARADGAGELRTLFQVVIPVLKGPMAGVAIINAIGIWSELLFSYLLLTEPDKRTLPSAVIAFTGNYVTDHRLLYAGLLITVLPVLVFYLAMSRLIRKGMTAGSLK
ncbi:ABC transporter permease subunit [Streptomyces sp. 3MP-14]|uniref:ABC transporter permease subunit n=1 Tax=Streptomyces mimosae TaxID=2586635 RepID=A0A5N6AFJ4_9ACTN|nr:MULTISPECIES: carbohydrate ABC transporter permease [Streptomyces]KAB8166328.1 ABC transporter permease subunit [Streptomyces mimosae]KAB8174121.1 ABC transporter permease subunit [Streptomyces sp. 3MP-14]